MPLQVRVNSNVALNNTATNNATSVTCEPSVAANGDRLFVTGNWFASASVDGGASWTYLNPSTALTAPATQFCCDQLCLYEPERQLWIWLLQYRTTGPTAARTGSNVFRIAVTSDANFPGGWYWWDIAPTTLNAGWNNLWFDYPDAALSEGHLYLTYNVFDFSDTWQRAAVMRFSLDQLARSGGMNFGWWSTTENGSLRLTQQASPSTEMYFGSHINGRELRLFSWPDTSNTVEQWDIGVRPWSSNIASTAPNAVDWLGRTDPRITGACLGDDKITFMWTAGADASHPQAFCEVARIDAGTKRVIDQPEIWSRNEAWAYPSASTNSDGIVGFSAFRGGGTGHPAHAVGARDDGVGGWRAQTADRGSNSPNANPSPPSPANSGSWGDYVICRADGADRRSWVASGFTLEGGSANQNVVPRVVRFDLNDLTPASVVVSIDFDGRDDENIVADEVFDPPPSWFRVQPGFAPQPLDFRWGGELRAEYTFSTSMTRARTFQLTSRCLLFEGTSTSTNDLDGTGTLSLSVPDRSWGQATFTVTNTSEGDPDDFARLRIVVQNNPDGMLGLFSFWNGARPDNHITSNPRLVRVSGHAPDGYLMYRRQGILFDPDRPQPAGTLPLLSWWSSSRQDNWATTDPAWARRLWSSSGGYIHYRREGYIYDPARPMPRGTVPLMTWWNPARRDHFSSTRERWQGAVGTRREGYEALRLEGYVVRP